jgi:hypothetical protein
MAALVGAINTAEVALTAATAKTVIQYAAPSTGQLVKLLGWGVFFDGVSGTAEPVRVRLLMQTTAGTMSALNIRAHNRSSNGTFQGAAQTTATAEPTAGDVIESIEVHPQQGYEKIFPMGMEPILASGTRIGIECTAPAAVNALAKLTIEE